ncbi:uncharacterized protein LOC107050476 [Gallus gallus]|uniref:Gag polyprotein n=2 Tax=Gallus gallus TaxID=9031 RepID=A0A8V0YR41_CHICK|nr:uncharacterized protein LOC107050476 [Gallus gallus]
MDQVIKVLVQFCKDYCGKSTPSRKEIATVLSLLNELGELESPRHVLDSSRWDLLTSALCQRAMASQKATELKTWGLMLGALKAAREEDKLGAVMSGEGASGSGSLEFCRSGAQTGAQTTANKTATEREEDCEKDKEESQRLGGGATAPTAPPNSIALSLPPPYPKQPLYPSLATTSEQGAGPSPKGKEEGRLKLTDWGQIKEEVAQKGLAATYTLPVVVSEEGGPIWVPLDPKGVARMIEAVEKKGLKSPLTMNALEALTASGPMLPYDIENLMRMVLKPVQYTLWREEWHTKLKQMLITAQGDQRNPIYGSDIQRLTGNAPGLLTPQAQVCQLRPGELIATTDAAIDAFRKLARSAEPTTPWTEIAQGPTEPFQEFADRLIKAVEGSDLPRAVHGPVILDCLYQKSSEGVQGILRAAPGRLQTPGEAIKYVLDKQKACPSVAGEVAAAVAGVMMACREADHRSADRQLGPCFKCGQAGHIRAQCRMGTGGCVTCQQCGRKGHAAPQCRARRPPRQGNNNGRQSEHGDFIFRPMQAPDLSLPMAALSLNTHERPLVKATISCTNLPPDFQGPRSIFVTALIDSGADVTVVAETEWPSSWPAEASQSIMGVGGATPSRRSTNEVQAVVINRDGSLEKPALLTPLVARVPGTLLGRDFLRQIGARITNTASQTACLIQALNTTLPWDPQELDILGSQMIKNGTTRTCVTFGSVCYKENNRSRVCHNFDGNFNGTGGAEAELRDFIAKWKSDDLLIRPYVNQSWTMVSPINVESFSISRRYCGFTSNETRYYRGDLSNWCGSKRGKWSAGYSNGTKCSSNTTGCGGNCTTEWNYYAYGFTFRKQPEVLWNNGTAKALPPGIFLICGDRAWQGIPRNALGGPCYLGQLTMLSPNFTTWIAYGPNITGHRRSRRSLSRLSPDCGDELQLWSVTARIFASFFAPGIAAAQALKEIERLACWSVKQANLTSLILNAMLEDTSSIRHAVLQNRAAIDFLLLAQGHGCQDVEGMCCFNLSDHSESIHKALQAMKEHTEKIRVEDDPIGDWFTRTFGDLGRWLAKGVKTLLFALLVIACLLAIIPCIIKCFQDCLSRTMNQFMDERIKYHRIREQL